MSVFGRPQRLVPWAVIHPPPSRRRLDRSCAVPASAQPSRHSHQRGSPVRVRERALTDRKSPEIGDLFVACRSTTEHLRLTVAIARELAAIFANACKSGS